MDEPKTLEDLFRKRNIGQNHAITDTNPTPPIPDSTTPPVTPADEEQDVDNPQTLVDPIIEPEPVTEQAPEDVTPDTTEAYPEPVTSDHEETSTPEPTPVIQCDLQPLHDTVNQISQDVKALEASSQNTSREVREMRKYYHDEVAGTLRAMQQELEHYREVDRGRIFDQILSEIAKLHSENSNIIDTIDDEKLKKRLTYLFDDIVQILEMYGVSKLKSKPGDKRNPRHCKVIERVYTNDPSLQDTIAESRNTGFYIENRTLVPEQVYVNIYKETNADVPAEN